MTDQEIDRLTTSNGSEAAVSEQPTGGAAPDSSDRPGYYPSREMLDREMRDIKDEVLRMGSMVASQIGVAIEALVDHDAQKATEAIVGDGRINEAQRHISSLITTTIATQQPVARDLRFMLALDHVTYELERMGDHAAIGGQAGAQARARATAQALHGVADDGRAGRRAGARSAARAGRPRR